MGAKPKYLSSNPPRGAEETRSGEAKGAAPPSIIHLKRLPQQRSRWPGLIIRSNEKHRAFPLIGGGLHERSRLGAVPRAAGAARQKLLIMQVWRNADDAMC